MAVGAHTFLRKIEKEALILEVWFVGALKNFE